MASSLFSSNNRTAVLAIIPSTLILVVALCGQPFAPFKFSIRQVAAFPGPSQFGCIYPSIVEIVPRLRVFKKDPFPSFVDTVDGKSYPGRL